MEPEFNKFFKRSTTKAFTEVKATPVILVCIYNHNNTLITHDLLKTIFSQHGKVLRILIFEKVKVWKAFIEFSTLESAFDAKRNLNDFMIFSDGTRMNVYFSNLDTIKFQNNNSGGIDYTISEEGTPSDLQNIQIQSHLLPRNEMIIPDPTEVEHPTHNYQPIIRQDFQQNHTFDDKGDEIFKIINERQEKGVHQEDEEKHNNEDSGKNSFNPDFLTIFQSKPIQPGQIESQPFSKNVRTNTRPFEEADAIIRPVITRHSGHKHTAPPGLAGYQNMSMPPGNFIPRQTETRRMIPSPGSFNTIGQIPSPTKTNQIFRPSSIQDLPQRIIPPTNMNTLSQFEPRSAYMMNNQQSNFPYNSVEGNPFNRIPQGKMNQGPNIGSEQQQSHDINELNQDSTSYHNLFDLIDAEIITELNSKMKNLDINQPNYEAGPYGNNPFDSNDDKKSQVLYVKGLEDRDIQIQMIYNLFSNFGNVLKVIFIRSKAAALLEYENAEYATIAKDYLNNIVLMKKSLRIFFSNYSIINLRNKKTLSPLEEVYIGNPKTFRFKKNKNISINPPSATLHISNLAAEVANEEAIRNFFGMYGNILALKFLLIDNTKHQCLMKLFSIEESINIMAILHDAEFGGRRVQLSFTRSKI